jgi:hypothetical protein
VIEALQQMNFDSHIKLITSELNLNNLKDDEKKEEKYEDALEVKDLINKQKKKNKKRKRQPEFNEDMELEQLKMFEQAKLENMHSMIFSHCNSQEVLGSEYSNSAKLHVGENKKMRLEQFEKDLFASKSGGDEVDFD